MKTKIYVLRHPITLEIRYVGKTVATLSIRLSNHISETNSKQKKQRYINNWIKSLRPLRPTIELICETDGDGSEQEKTYIQYLRRNGCRLTNLTDGGEGTVGFKPTFTDEHRAKISAAKMGHQVTVETRAKLSCALKGRPASPETRIRLSLSLVGNKRSVGRRHSDETKAKMSAAHKGHKYNVGRKLTAEHKAKISAIHKGKQYTLGHKLSEEHKAKISAANKGRVYSPETRLRMSEAAKLREARKVIAKQLRVA